ncbi:tetratricopeptide repeat protein [Maribacter litopenaei]|uniref:Tetratricopeptide repeat protein n=1 Tax=Maribacter litopenaei TaxID=2976127 RepID=A0ABY5YBM9_9FLAO|nr:tetratricopeptide repeat protein [Maribacter litopenaei]UWX56453.1 tetratricopeptide repeat protein [Maribacter litopenaei]
MAFFLLFPCSILLSQENNERLDSLNQLLNQADSYKDSVDVLSQLAEFHMYNDSRKSISFANKISTISIHSDYGEGISDGYFLKANGFGALQIMDSALFYYQKAISVSKEYSIQRNLASSMANISVIEGQNGNYTRAILLMDTVATMNLEERDYLNYGVTLNNRAYHFYEQGDFVNAMKGFKKALSVLDTIPRDIFRRADVYRNIAKLNYQEEDYDDALDYLHKANTIYIKESDYLFQSYVWSDIGNVYLNRKDYDEAIKSYEQSITISNAHDFNESKALALGNLAIALREKGQYTNALKAFEESVKDIEHDESVANKVVHEYHPGYTYALMRDQERALLHLNRAIYWADSVGQANELKNALGFRSKSYALWGMDKKALDDILKMNLIKDSIFSTQKSETN